MKKVTSSTKMLIYPIPVVLFGTKVENRPTYSLLGNCGIMCLSPATLYVSSMRDQYTNKGVVENKTFSVNIPDEKIVVESDYCGIKTGHKTDKSKIFKTFYGKLETAPMIEECPVNMECKLIRQFRVGSMDVFVGEVVETYLDEVFESKGKPNIVDINPLVYSMDCGYYKVGDFVAKAFSIGKDYPQK